MSKIEKQYRTLLFDVDGTLLDFDAAERRGLETVFNRNGWPTQEMIACYAEINRDLWSRFEKGEIAKAQITNTRFERVFQAFGIQADGLETERQYRDRLNHSAILMDGAKETLGQLKGRYDLYVVTNGFTQTQRMRMASSGLEDYFKASFISEEVGYQKPQREFFDYCFERMPGADRGETLIIGDSLSSDMKGGNNAGIDTCWLNPGGAVNGGAAKVTYELQTLAQLAELLS